MEVALWFGGILTGTQKFAYFRPPCAFVYVLSEVCLHRKIGTTNRLTRDKFLECGKSGLQHIF